MDDCIAIVNPQAKAWYQKIGVSDERAEQLKVATTPGITKVVNTIILKEDADVEHLICFADQHAANKKEFAFLLINGYDLIQKTISNPATVLLKHIARDVRPEIVDDILLLRAAGKTPQEIQSEIKSKYPTGVYASPPESL